MANQPQSIPQRSNQSVTLTRQESVEIIQGPLPDPDVLARFKVADPSFPERIMKMAEAHSAADVKAKNRISWGNLIIPILGQVFTLVLGVGSVLAGIYLAKAGYTGPAIASITAGFAPIVIAAFRNLKRKG